MKITIEDYYFSAGLKWTFAVVNVGLCFYSAVYTSLFWVPFVLILLSLITFSTKYSLIIDPNKKEIIDSFQFLWLTTKSDSTSFNTLERITVGKERHTYSAESRSRSRTVDFNEYIGKLEFDGGKSIELKRSVNYQDFAEQIRSIAEKINLEVERLY